MPQFAVTCIYTDDSAGRDELRPEHKRFLGNLADQGFNLCSGLFAQEETPGALLLVRAESKDRALALTEEDPFRVDGLVSEVVAREWNPTSGRLAGEVQDC